VFQAVSLAQAQADGDRQTDHADQRADGENPRPETFEGGLGIIQAGYMVMSQVKLPVLSRPTAGA